MENNEKIFSVKRFKPEIAISLQRSYIRSARGPNKRTYCLLSDEKRHELIDKIVHNRMKATEVAAQYNIHYMTVRNVLKIYRNEGRIEKKKARKRLDKTA
eukprot:TRINITY_DN2011_c0_g1_i1.p2 TRINITY_DN2011_c0_g1~~TRINITY_DN2011_c0_g1_i1.p2  ORF type:complete len:100 (+),score=5.88 TRINITY_DN2011_c0_g1_i1:191-490(+)